MRRRVRRLVIQVCGLSKVQARLPRIKSIDAPLARFGRKSAAFGGWTVRSTPTVCHPFEARRNVNVTGISHTG